MREEAESVTQGRQSLTFHSERYGTLEISEEQIYRFEKGIIGLQEIRRYALIQLDNFPFSILHALDAQISFIVIPAAQVVDNYGFHIDDETAELLGVERPEEVETWLIVNVIEDQVYVNLKAPVLLSPAHRSGVQFIIHDQELPIRHPLIRASKEGAADAGS